MTESRASDIAVGASVPDPACLGVADPRTEAAPDGIDVYFDGSSDIRWGEGGRAVIRR